MLIIGKSPWRGYAAHAKHETDGGMNIGIARGGRQVAKATGYRAHKTLTLRRRQHGGGHFHGVHLLVGQRRHRSTVMIRPAPNVIVASTATRKGSSCATRAGSGDRSGEIQPQYPRGYGPPILTPFGADAGHGRTIGNGTGGP
jgi:hypothetical protein